MAASVPSRQRSVSLGRLLLVFFAGLVLVFLALPTIVVVPVSLSPTEYLSFPPESLTLRWYGEFLTDEKWVRATLLSLRIGLSVTLLTTIVGTMAALAIVRGLRGGGPLVNALVTAPLVIPTIVYAIAILLFFSKIGVSGSFWGFVFAHSALAVPYVVLIVSAALYRFDASTELAAQSLGASRVQAIWHVTLPAIRPALATGAIFAFLTSFDDATVSFFLANLNDVTLPRKMFENLQFFVSPVLAVVATLLTLFTLALFGAAQWLRTNRNG
ncbi:MAG: ABC transporter permease [Rhizobiaceae bacterium]|nr:ABC transporter permease [Rhizobiaceae bacterium]